MYKPTKKQKQEFIDFLKKEGVFVEFVCALANPKWLFNVDKGMSLSQQFSTVCSFDYVEGAFLWERESKGYTFWNRISRKWRYKY